MKNKMLIYSHLYLIDDVQNYSMTICIGTDEGVIYVWLIPKPKKDEFGKPNLLYLLGGHMQSPVTSLAVHQSGILLASGRTQ